MIEMMKFDMGGLGAVLGAASAISAIDSASAASDSAPTEGGRRLLDGVEVHFISAVCENMISRDAMRPGDVVTASNGKTIEIINTGRGAVHTVWFYTPWFILISPTTFTTYPMDVI